MRKLSFPVETKDIETANGGVEIYFKLTAVQTVALELNIDRISIQYSLLIAY